MQKFKVNTDGKSCAIDIGVAVRRPAKVRIRAVNPLKRGVIYLDRYGTIKGTGEFTVRLPYSPKEVLLLVDCLDVADDDNVRVTKLKKRKLDQFYSCLRDGKRTTEFVKFAQDFCEKAGTLSIGRYKSDGGHFTIDYFKQITDKGRVINTPARISNQTGRIELSKADFMRYTVPMRMAILLHEYSHFYLNEVQHDEVEADLNGLKIYLGLGYPVIEAHKAFLNVFKTAPTKTNKDRYDYIKGFIDRWDEIKYQACLL